MRPRHPDATPSPLRSRRGNYMITMAGFLPVFVGFAALSVDISYINMSRTQSQHVADAASHAAYVAYRSSQDETVGDAAANWILDQNLVGNKRATLDDVVYGSWDFVGLTFTANDPDVNAAQASVSRLDINGNALDLFFAPLLQKPTHDVQAAGVTAGRARNIMIIQDISGSYGSEILDARDADVAFLQYMIDHPAPGDMLGMTVFSGRESYTPLYEMSLIETEKTDMLAQFDKVRTCDDLGGLPFPMTVNPSPGSNCWTNTARGVLEAIRQMELYSIQDEYRAFFLMTDGLPNTALAHASNGLEKDDTPPAVSQGDTEDLLDLAYNGGSHPFDNWTCLGAGGTNCDTRPDSVTLTGGGVHVSPITLCQPDCSGTAWMGTLVRGDGESYESPEPEELSELAKEAASRIPIVVVF